MFDSIGGAEGDRTPDLRIANAALCQTELLPHADFDTTVSSFRFQVSGRNKRRAASAHVDKKSCERAWMTRAAARMARFAQLQVSVLEEKKKNAGKDACEPHARMRALPRCVAFHDACVPRCVRSGDACAPAMRAFQSWAL